MKIVLAGGSGHVGAVIKRHFLTKGCEIIQLSRKSVSEAGVKTVTWDGQTIGDWATQLDGSDIMINLAGRSVDCRYTPGNLKMMLDSRVNSTRAIGEALRACKEAPRVWLQASTATIYAHSIEHPNDEKTGTLGGGEPSVPRTWNESIKIAKAWEQAAEDADVPLTRKVLLRSALTLSIDRGSVFDRLADLAEKGLGGRFGSGQQYVSWVHEQDFARAIEFLIDRDDLSGPVNVCSPHPLPQKQFATILRETLGVKFALPAPAPLVELGTWLLRTESELVLKSRRVVPGLLLEEGFVFQFPNWREAAEDLVRRRLETKP